MPVLKFSMARDKSYRGVQVKGLYHRILKDFSLDTLLKIYEARTIAMVIKPKLRNLYKDHPKYETFYCTISRKHNIDIRWLYIYCELSTQQSIESMGGLGGSCADYSRAYKLINEAEG